MATIDEQMATVTFTARELARLEASLESSYERWRDTGRSYAATGYEREARAAQYLAAQHEKLGRRVRAIRQRLHSV